MVPLHAGFGPSGFTPYVLNLAALGLAEEGDVSSITTAVVVMTRQDGVLLALPELALPAEVLSAGLDRGPAPEPILRQIDGAGRKPSPIREVGYHSLAVPQGARRHQHEASRGHQLQAEQRCPRTKSPIESKCTASQQEEAKGKGRRSWKGHPKGGPAGGRRTITSDDERLTEEISVQHLCASLPRWILRSKTKFSSFLARTFHLTGSAPDSAVLPIPAPRLGLFCGQGISKLSTKRWLRLCRQRVLHVIVTPWWL